MSIRFKVRYSVLLCLSLSAFAVPDLVRVKTHLRHYLASGHYTQDLAHACRPAMQYLQKRVAHNHRAAQPQKLAVVFDIDETLLSNAASIQSLDFGGNAALFHAHERKANAARIASTGAIFDYARQHGVAIFLVTGRSYKMQLPTIKNLKKQGLVGYQKLIMWPRDSMTSVGQYKAHARCQILQQGYHIVLNVGDQWSDMDVRCLGEMPVKLPNPFYFIPTSHKRSSH